MSAIIKILGRIFKGSNLTVDNGKVIIDGKVVSDHGDKTRIVVEVNGDVNTLNCNTCVIHGNVKGDVDSNTVNCGDVGGDVDANTVNCGNVGGRIDANTVNRR